MGKYLEHTEYYNNGDLDSKELDAICFIVEELAPDVGDSFFIMDPHLDVVSSIQRPFKEAKVESSIWCMLLAELIKKDITFQIITRQPIDGVTRKDHTPPYIFTCNPIASITTTIQVCQYNDNRHCEMSLHDRFILKRNANGVCGVHVGPSLANIRNKDVSLTLYNTESADSAYNAFYNLWNACIDNNEWKM